MVERCGDRQRKWDYIFLSPKGARRQFRNLSGKIQRRLLRIGLNVDHIFGHASLPTTQGVSLLFDAQKAIPWFAPGDLARVQMRNADDVRCASWVGKNITDQDAPDAAIQCAGAIRWFDDGIAADPPYDLIVSIFHACFSSDGEVYPGPNDRAYYSGRAILWIHTLATCKSRMIPLPTAQYRATGFYDLQQLLRAISTTSAQDRFGRLLLPRSKFTTSHLQWISNVLLHLS